MNIRYYLGIFKALADRTRVRIVWVLIKAKTELCVCEIMDILNESQYNISRHLRELKIAGLVRERKEGKWVFYSLITHRNKFQKLLWQTILSIPEAIFSDDEKRLKRRLSLRRDGVVVVGMDSPEWRRITKEFKKKRGRVMVKDLIRAGLPVEVGWQKEG